MKKKSKLKNFYKTPYLGAGFLIFSTIACQTLGLRTTTAANTAFITCLYVLIVPILDILFFKKKTSALHFLWVFLAFIGMALILDFQSQEFKINYGDFWTLASAFFGAGHILWIGHYANREEPLELHFGQCLWTAIFSLICCLAAKETFSISEVNSTQLIHFSILAVGVSFFAFLLQISAQKKISSAVASLIFLLEAPFAAVFGWILLSQELSNTQIFGALLILASCGFAILFSKNKENLGVV